MLAFAAFAIPVFSSIFAIGLAAAPRWLRILCAIGAAWFVALYVSVRLRTHVLADPATPPDAKR